MTWYLENEGGGRFCGAIVDHRLLSTSSFSEEFVWPIRASAWSFGIKALHDIFKLAKYPSYRIFRYVAQYVLFRIISERWRRSSQNCWITFFLDVFAVRSRTSVWRRREFWQEHFHDISNMQHTEALGPIFRYVAQYNIYRNISDGKRRTNKDCWITFERVVLLFVQNVFLNEDGVWRKTVHANSNMKIPKLQANISICCSICSWILSNGQRRSSKVVELPLTLWSSMRL